MGAHHGAPKKLCARRRRNFYGKISYFLRDVSLKTI
jgi:hypothetical protein